MHVGDLVGCPECGLPAEVTDYFYLPSTDGEALHIRTLCVAQHHLTQLKEGNGS